MTARILLPHAKDVLAVKVDKGDKTTIKGIVLDYGRRLLSFGDDTDKYVPPSAAIYDSPAPYPGVDFEHVSTEVLCGHRIAVVNVFPLQYFPKRRVVEYYSDLEITVALKAEKRPVATLRRLPQDVERVRSVILNPSEEILGSYEEKVGGPLDSGCYECGGMADYTYVIVTTAAFSGPFGYLTSHKMNRLEDPITATVVTLEDILVDPRFVTNSSCMASLGYSDFPAHDDSQARIRNFIRYAYHCWGTDFVLLAGDADRGQPGGEGNDSILPVREMYPRVTPQGNAAEGEPVVSDLYYACLDGAFDADGDSDFGEPEDSPDLFAEVFVGRAPVDREMEVWNFVSKICEYEASPPAPLALMVGEQLGSIDKPFGYLVDFAQPHLDEIREGSAEYGRLSAGYPPVFSVTNFYEKDANWTKQDLLDRVNRGDFHILNHLGHAATLKVMKLCHSLYPEPEIGSEFCGGDPPVDDLPDIEKVFFVYSEGCFPNAFDNYYDLLSGGNGFTKTDCVAEGLLLDHPDRGAWSLVGNTRFGKAAEDTTDFPAARFHRTFMDALFKESLATAHPRNLGWVLARSREALQGLVEDDYMLYTYYQLNLTGDPETRIQIPSPDLPVADLYLRRKTHWEDPQSYGTVSILGTASRGFSRYASMDRFEVSYGLQGQAGGEATGITLTGQGTAQVLGGEVAAWDLSQIPPSLPKAGVYEVLLRVWDFGGAETQDSVEYYLNRYVKATWVGAAGWYVDSSPVMANLDTDPEDEIVVGSHDQKVYAYNVDGSRKWVSPDLLSFVTASPAIGDLDNDGDLEVVVGTSTLPVSFDRGVYALRGSDGTVKWQALFSQVACIWATPLLADLNEDGFLEVVVAVSLDEDLCGIHCLDRTGQSLWHFHSGTGFMDLRGSPAVGDVSGDGHDDLVFAAGGADGGRVTALSGSGIELWHYDGGAGWKPKSFRSSVVLGDIDADRALEVIVGSEGGNVCALEGNGTEKWVIEVGASVRSLALGDVDGDGHLEILAGAQDNCLYILSHSGSLQKKIDKADTRILKNDLWEPLGVLTAPALVDLDGDGIPEILFGSTDHQLRAVKHTNEELWRFNFQNSIFSSPVVGDADHDGFLELAAGCRGASLRWLEMEHSWERTKAPWPMFRHDPRRTGCTPVKRSFKRGDASGDGLLSLSDVAVINGYLAGSGSMPACMDAADADDDGSVTHADSSYILDYLFSGGPSPPLPHPGCGEDPSEDALSCYSYGACP